MPSTTNHPPVSRHASALIPKGVEATGTGAGTHNLKLSRMSRNGHLAKPSKELEGEGEDWAPIDCLVDAARKYLHMPDPGVMYVTMGALAANVLSGPHVWLMLVGPPSTGKTELLMSTTAVPRVHSVDDLASVGSLLSGSSQKDKVKGATGGLLRMVGAHGAIILDDFTGILAKSADKRNELVGAMRQMHKGRYAREIGTDGGRQLVWHGRCGMLAGCTDAIDQAHEISQFLGERWVFYRHRPGEIVQYEMSRRAMRNAHEEGWQEELKDLVAGMFMALDLQFDSKGPSGQGKELTPLEESRLIRMGFVGVKCRSGMIRDARTKDIIAPPVEEGAARMGGVLAQLYRGMFALGVREEERWRVLTKVVLDSMPLVRRMVVERVWKEVEEKGKGVLVKELLERIKVSRSVLDRHLHEMEVFGVVKKEVKGGVAVVGLNEGMRRELNGVCVRGVEGV